HPALHYFPTRRSSDLILEAHVLLAAVEAEPAEQAAPPQAAPREVRRDAHHPAPERGAVAQRLEALERLDEGVLHDVVDLGAATRSEEHTSELQSRENL